MRTYRTILGAGLLTLCWLGAPARADEGRLDVQVGWGGVVRPGYWNPVFLTLSHPSAQAASLELTVNQDALFAMRIHQRNVAVGPQPRTISLMAMLGSDWRSGFILLRDEKGRRLMQEPLGNEAVAAAIAVTETGYGGKAIGVSGRGPALAGLAGAWEEPRKDTGPSSFHVGVGFLRPELLPTTAIGYDSLDLLVLNQPDLNRMGLDQQQAILGWVRAGGRLLMWLSDGPPPEDSPLIAALPAEIGAMTTAQVSSQELVKRGLPQRLQEMRCRPLRPKPGMATLRLLEGPQVALVHGRLGLGRMAVASVDASLLQFGLDEQARQFWRPILADALQLHLSPPPSWQSVRDQRQATAMSTVVDLLGSIEGVGRFDFTYPALVLLGMIVLVGPVDWLVLKRLGRLHWTWITTSTWIVLITTGAVYAGHILKSGQLHFRTLQLIDQADDSTVASSHVALLYSPRTRSYAIDFPIGSWWAPGSANLYSHSGLLTATLSADQEMLADGGGLVAGNVLRPMTIHVWNLRYVAGTRIEPAGSGPRLRASLRQGPNGTIVGTVTNLGKHPLTEILVETQRGTAVLGPDAKAQPIAPGATVEVRCGSFRKRPSPTREYGRATEESLIRCAGDLAASRSLSIESLLSADRALVCVYAQSQADPVTQLDDPTSLQEHHQVVRALVRLQTENMP